jgi:two-component system, OmpR family, phosphate regulon sensor histidine kinase PhoR
VTKRRHYWRLLVFICVLILPSLLIAWEGWRNVRLDRDKRLNDARALASETRLRTQKELGRDAWELLQDIKTQEIGDSPTSNPSVRLVAWEAEGQLVMPWETDPNERVFSRATQDSGFTTGIDSAESAETFEKRPDRAVSIYRELIRSAGNDFERADARLRLARVLRRTSPNADADGIYRELLNLSSDFVDRDGYSFASIAAGALIKTSGRDVLTRALRELESPAALTLGQAYRWRSLLEQLRDAGNESLKEEARQALQRFTMRIERLEQAQKQLESDPEVQRLREDFQGLGVTDRTWQPYGADLLISRASLSGISRTFVVAVSLKALCDMLRASHSSGPDFALLTRGSGEALNEAHFPGLKIAFADMGDMESGLDLKRSFYVPAIALVISLNLIGGYLLWRDTRREMRLAELRSQFVSSVSHELKTPLTSIRMFAEILKTQDSVDDLTKGECLDTIVNESERLTRLLNNVLDFSRIEHGQRAYRMESVQLSEVVSAAAKTMQYPLTEQGFALRIDVAEGIPPVEADRDALKQAILNLLTNAMKYSGQSRGIELRLLPQNGDALIQVADHGIGIPEHEQPRIFEKFYRARVPENHAISGTGLGLALVAHIVQGHGGTIHIDSAPGRGSTFSIRIPVRTGGSA